VVEKRLARRRQLDPARTAIEQLGAYLLFQIADLAAQRRLRGVQPAFGCHRQATRLGYGDEIPQMAKFHRPSVLIHASQACQPAYKVF
jgi:hypothetical protein